MSRRQILGLVAIGSVLLAGCLSGVGPSTTPARSLDERPSPTATPTSTQPADQPCPEAISFWNLGGPAGWAPDEVSVGFHSPADVAVFFVVSENDIVFGVRRWPESPEIDSNAVTVDGYTITLDEELEGSHTIKVIAYPDTNKNGEFGRPEDTNGNGEFDRGTDRLCYYHGTRNQAGPTTINFSSLTATETEN